MDWGIVYCLLLRLLFKPHYKSCWTVSPQALNISPRTLKTITIKAFRKAAQLSSIVKIEKKYCVPHPDWETLDPANPMKDFIGEIWNATNAHQDVKPNAKTAGHEESAATISALDSITPTQTDIGWLQDFTLKAMNASDPNSIFRRCPLLP